MSATETNPLNRVECDFHEYGIDGEYTFGSSDPGEDGFSLYHGQALLIRNPFEDIGEQYATDETVAKLIELASAYKEGEIDDVSHLDPRGSYYTEEFAIEFVAVYQPGESDLDAQMRMINETDMQRCHNECQIFFTFRDRFAEACGVDVSTLYPYNLSH